jgi:hypothetical protein
VTRVEEFGDVKLILADCREVLEIKPHSVDFIFCDPPIGDVRELALGQATEDEADASGPIHNDDPQKAKILMEWAVQEATKSLVKGGCICCCCPGGGGEVVALAEWPQMIAGVPHLEFKQVVVWDRGPVGRGGHYRSFLRSHLGCSTQGRPM